MSFNDRCGEAAEILRYGGVLPLTFAVRHGLIEALEDGRDGIRFPSRDLVDAIRTHPDNADLLAQTCDGEWIGRPAPTTHEEPTDG